MSGHWATPERRALMRALWPTTQTRDVRAACSVLLGGAIPAGSSFTKWVVRNLGLERAPGFVATLPDGRPVDRFQVAGAAMRAAGAEAVAVRRLDPFHPASPARPAEPPPRLVPRGTHPVPRNGYRMGGGL